MTGVSQSLSRHRFLIAGGAAVAAAYIAPKDLFGQAEGDAVVSAERVSGFVSEAVSPSEGEPYEDR